MSRLLLLHTCAPESFAALADADGVAVEPLPSRGSSEQLVPAIRRLLATVSWPVSTLAAIAVVDGPGSFTGSRVGLSAAKGLCEAAAIPLIAISRLALLCSTSNHPGEMLALLDAGRGEYFAGIYLGSKRIAEQLITAAALPALATGRHLLTSEPRVAESVRSSVHWETELLPEPGPDDLLPMAAQRLRDRDFTDIASSDANYLRRTDAEILLQSR